MTVVPAQCPITLPGLRKQALSWAVLDGAKVIAVFADENMAVAYRMRLASIRREMRV
jgi:hypothetical protein